MRITAQRLFHQPRLRVGAVEHGDARRLVALSGLAQILLDVVRDEERLVFAVGRLVVADVRAALPLRPQILALALRVARDDRGCCFQDDLRGAVVLLQANGLRFGKVFLELEDVADVRTAPAVDALVLVSNNANIVMIAGEKLHQLVLRTVGVLVLVDHDVAEAAVVTLARFATGFQQAHRLEQQVVEVECVVLEQLLAIDLVQLRDALADGVARSEVVLLRIDHVVLGPADLREHRARRQCLVVERHAPHRLLHDGLLIAFVVDGEAAGEPLVADAQRLDVAAQHAHAEGVKGGKQRLGQGGAGEQLIDALAHFGRGLVGKGDREDGVRRDTFRFNEIRNAVGDDAGLPRAGAGQDQDRTVRGLHGGALLRVHLFEQGIHRRVSRWELLSLVYRRRRCALGCAWTFGFTLEKLERQRPPIPHESDTEERKQRTTECLRLLRLQPLEPTRSFWKQPERWAWRSPNVAGIWSTAELTSA